MKSEDIEQIFKLDLVPDELFKRLLPALGNLLQCDRCFLYVRHPDRRLGRSSHCWRQQDTIPEIYNEEWLVEDPAKLEKQDPLFAAALRTEPSIFVEDVETASPLILNQKFEREHLGHRALVHAHILHEGQLWGILQPCIFEQPRVWSAADQSTIQQVTSKLPPRVKTYVETHCPDLKSSNVSLC